MIEVRLAKIWFLNLMAVESYGGKTFEGLSPLLVSDVSSPFWDAQKFGIPHIAFGIPLFQNIVNNPPVVAIVPNKGGPNKMVLRYLEVPTLVAVTLLF